MEIDVVITKLFNSLKDIIPNTITLKTHTKRELEPINDNSSIGEQIKYYRIKKDIKQTDLSLKLGYTRDALFHIENQEMKLVDINLLKGIFKELDIEDKININDDYISFLLNNPCERILKIRKEMNLTRQQLADIIGVNIISVRRWELGNCHISRKMFNQLKKCMS